MNLADRVSPVLAAGTKGNPRQIKRFLNALALRLAVAQERGFGNAIEQPHLAKVMLAEMFLHPTVFDHMATTAASSEDGICPEIALIEKLAAGGTEPASASEEDAAPEAGNPVIDEWKTRPDVMRWAAVKPDLGAVSLKPYLFVIKDRKNYLGAAAPLPPKLAALLERLLGGEMSAKGALADVKGLNRNPLVPDWVGGAGPGPAPAPGAPALGAPGAPGGGNAGNGNPGGANPGNPGHGNAGGAGDGDAPAAAPSRRFLRLQLGPQQLVLGGFPPVLAKGRDAGLRGRFRHEGMSGCYPQADAVGREGFEDVDVPALQGRVALHDHGDARHRRRSQVEIRHLPHLFAQGIE